MEEVSSPRPTYPESISTPANTRIITGLRSHDSKLGQTRPSLPWRESHGNG
jgi:hypothetical protein